MYFNLYVHEYIHILKKKGAVFQLTLIYFNPVESTVICLSNGNLPLSISYEANVNVNLA